MAEMCGVPEMAETPTIATYALPADRVTLEGFEARTLRSSLNGVLQRFEGERNARLTVGPGITQAWDISAVGWRDSDAQVIQLRRMFEAQETAADPRMLLTTGGRMENVYSKAIAIQVLEWSVEITPRAGIRKVSFTAQRVEG